MQPGEAKSIDRIDGRRPPPGGTRRRRHPERWDRDDRTTPAGPVHPPAHRRRARCPAPPGRGGRGPARRRRDGAVHRPLPQGGHRHPRRRPAPHAGGAAGLPARAGGPPRRGAGGDPQAGQARPGAGGAHPRGRVEGPPRGHLPAVQAEAAHQGPGRPGERPRAAGRRAARRPHAGSAGDGRGLRERAGPRRRRGAGGRPRRSSSNASPRTPTSSAASASGCGRAGGWSRRSARARRPTAPSTPTTSTTPSRSPSSPRTASSRCSAGRRRRCSTSRWSPTPIDTAAPGAVTDWERLIAAAAGVRDRGPRRPTAGSPTASASPGAPAS